MKHKALLLLATLFAAFSLQAQDKVTKTVLELGKTDNRTMEHADYIARNIGGRIVGSHMLNHDEDWVASSSAPGAWRCGSRKPSPSTWASTAAPGSAGCCPRTA